MEFFAFNVTLMNSYKVSGIYSNRYARNSPFCFLYYFVLLLPWAWYFRDSRSNFAL